MSVSTEKFNLRNPAVKRILQEIKEFQKEPSTEVYAEAVEGNIFEWHFVVRGPPETEFEDYTKNERAVLALRSRAEPPQFGNIERQQLINDMHQRVLAAGAQEVSAKPLVQEETPAVAAVDKPEFGTLDDAGSQPRDLARQVAVSEMPPSQPVARASHPAVPSDVADRRESSILAGTPERMQDRLGAPPPYMGQTIGGTVHAAQPGQLGTQGAGIQVSAAGAYTQQHNSWEDTTLTFLATTLTVIIIAILFRRLLRVTGTDLWAIL